MEINIEVLFPSGDLLLSTDYRGNYYKFRYSGYTKREAKTAFKAYVKEQDALIIREVR